jgi:NhaP-type Na+/H+ or K+/H+ antiporter
LRAAHREALGLDEFLTLGLIGLSYGAALLCHAYGFLAVFAAGLAMRRIEANRSGNRTAEPLRAPKQAPHPHVVSSEPEHAGRHMAQAVLHFNEQLERIGEVGVVVMIGAMRRWPEGSEKLSGGSGPIFIESGWQTFRRENRRETKFHHPG